MSVQPVQVCVRVCVRGVGQPVFISTEGVLTFLPPEEVLSGFTESLFSLLEDLERLVFSFSAERGASEDGLVLLLFLQESGEEYETGLWERKAGGYGRVR